MAFQGLKIRHKKSIAGLTQELAGMVLATSTEVARAQAAEAQLGSDIAAEAARAQGVEGSLGNLVTENKTSLVNSINELHQDAINEKAFKDTSLSAVNTRIDTEINDRTAGDLNLQNQINLLETASGGDTAALQTALADEIARATTAEQANGAAITSEVGTRISEITRVEGLISQEATNRTNEDLAIDGRLDIIEAGMTAGTLWKGSVENVSDLDGLDESAQVDGFAYSVTSQNDAYVYTSTSAGDYQPVGYTGGFIKFADFTEISQLVNGEEARAVAAEGVLTTALANEIADRVAADAAHTQLITDEVTRSTAEDATLNAALAAEVTARENGDTNLQTQIDNLGGTTGAADAIQDSRLDVIEGDYTVAGSVEKALFDAKAYADTEKLAKSMNLADVADVPAARINLDVMSTSEISEAIRLGGSVPIFDTVVVSGDKVTFTEVPKNGVIFGGVIEVEYTENGYMITDRVTANPDPADATGKVFILDVETSNMYDTNEASATYIYVEDASGIDGGVDGSTI